MEKNLSREANSSSSRQELHAFYGIQDFIRPVVFVKAWHLSLFWAIKLHAPAALIGTQNRSGYSEKKICSHYWDTNPGPFSP